MAQDEENGIHFALKIIDKRNPNFNLEKVKNEIEILQQLDHPNIIKIIEYIEDCIYQKKMEKS